MSSMVCGLLAEVDLTSILQFAIMVLFIFVPIVLFAWYKFVSNKRRHALKLIRLEKGLAGIPGPDKGPKWGRSIYLGAFFCIVSAFFAYGFFGADSDAAGLAFVVLLGLGVLFLIRGILKRTSWIKHLALQRGIPFERVFPIKPRRALWITNFAAGLPLMLFAGYLFLSMQDVYIFGSNATDYAVLGITFCLGSFFFLRGIFLAWYLRCEDKPALSKECSEPVLTETV